MELTWEEILELVEHLKEGELLEFDVGVADHGID